MKSVVTMENVENLNKKLSKDFYIVPNLKFDIDKLRSDLEKILKKKRDKIEPVGFIIGLSNIYLSTNNGRLFIIDIATGKRVSILKIDNDKISRPIIIDKNLFVIKDVIFTTLSLFSKILQANKYIK